MKIRHVGIRDAVLVRGHDYMEVAHMTMVYIAIKRGNPNKLAVLKS